MQKDFVRSKTEKSSYKFQLCLLLIPSSRAQLFSSSLSRWPPPNKVSLFRFFTQYDGDDYGEVGDGDNDEEDEVDFIIIIII